ncbi:MAG: MBOAT family protein [Coriobacteriia bacterium]|nr:MBOAT family protein [Coriobacteriia bacterium]
MVFSSLAFLCVFLPVVFLLYVLLPQTRAKNALLIVASLVFYAYGEPVYVVLLLASALLNWVLGLAIGDAARRQGSGGRRRVALIVAVTLNLAFLVVFKYSGWLLTLANQTLGTKLAAPHLALPIGISFYTFQALSYVIDVYRGTSAPQRSFFRLLLFISLFPQLLAGPIIKYHELEAQLARRRVTVRKVATGLRRFAVGLAKKVLIAIPMAAVVDAIYAAPHNQINIAVAWIAALAFLAQIYFDFSGYSDMAIGLASMFGFSYAENFDHPYISRSIQEFWRRWHISLSSWFTTYLYIPLGGNRKGRVRAVLNRFVVFVLCGLWHGANLTFLVWGAFQGFLMMLEELLPLRKLPRALGWFYAFVMVCLGFVVFRASSVAQALFMLRQMFAGFNFSHLPVARASWMLSPLVITVFCVAIVASTPFARQLIDYLRARVRGLAPVVRVASYVSALALFVMCFLSLSVGGYHPFIYFRF